MARTKRIPTYEVVKPKAADLRAIRNYAVDTIIRWARSHGYCEEVESALEAVFGAASRPAAGWRDSDGRDIDGRDINGLDIDGRDVDGYNEKGFREDGFNKQNVDEEGYDRAGYNEAGVNRKGEPREHLERFLAGLTESDRIRLERLIENTRRVRIHRY